MSSLSAGLAGIDPQAWMLTLPVVLAVVAVALQPTGSRVRQWCDELMRAEAMAWAQLTGHVANDLPAPAWRRGLLCSTTIVLAVGTLLSMGSYFNVLG